jgi:hypothetical protein
VSDVRASVHSCPAPFGDPSSRLRADCRRVAESDTEVGRAVETQNGVPERQHRMTAAEARRSRRNGMGVVNTHVCSRAGARCSRDRDSEALKFTSHRAEIRDLQTLWVGCATCRSPRRDPHPDPAVPARLPNSSRVELSGTVSSERSHSDVGAIHVGACSEWQPNPDHWGRGSPMGVAP